MPEANDRVVLYFPSENETYALVMGAVNNDGNGRFTDVANRNYHVGDSDFNMVLAKDSLTTNAASSISQIANSISESAENISNNAKIYLETIRDEKIVTANNILQIAQENMSIQSNGDTQINSDGVSLLNGGNDVLINK